MDVLSQSLEQLRLRGATYRSLELGGAFRLDFGNDRVRGIHILMRGQCELLVDGRPPQLLSALDYVVLPHGTPHALRSLGSKRAPRVPLPRQDALSPFRYRGPGEQPPVHVACGVFQFGASADHVVLEALPPVLTVAARAPGSPIAAHVESLLVELAAPQDGTDVVVARLSDVLLVHAIRQFAATCARDPAPQNALAGLRHPQIGLALRLMHEAPEQPWTVASLARRVGLSRAAFAERFRRQVGDSPLRYLTRFRLSLATDLLRDTSEPLKTIAQRTGYGSPAALSLAFRRHAGMSPGALRRPRAASE